MEKVVGRGTFHAQPFTEVHRSEMEVRINNACRSADAILRQIDLLSNIRNLPYGPGEVELYYHLREHTFGKGGVFERTRYYAEKEGLCPRDVELACIAAAFHDTGFVYKYWLNEPIGAKFARNFMLLQISEGGRVEYHPNEIQIVSTGILSTGPKRDSEGRLIRLQNIDHEIAALIDIFDTGTIIRARKVAEVVCDGDVENLGRKDCFQQSFRVAKEMNLVDPSKGTDEAAVLKNLLFVMEKHGGFLTRTAIEEVGPGWISNHEEALSRLRRVST